MKLLHISDLHIGKRVNAFSMIEDQKYILRQILAIADRLLEAKQGAGEKKIQNESSEPKQQEKEENARNLTQEKDLPKEEAAAGKAQNGGKEKESRKDVIPKPVKAAGICLAGAVLVLGLLWQGKRWH